MVLAASVLLLALAGCGSQATPTPATPGVHGARATLELFGRDIATNRSDDACQLLSPHAFLAVSGRLAAAERTPPSGAGLPDQVCAGAVAIVRAYIAGGQTSATQLNTYLRSVTLVAHGQTVLAPGLAGALSTLSYQRGRWHIER